MPHPSFRPAVRPSVLVSVCPCVVCGRFFTYNYLQEAFPKQDTTIKKLGRNAIIGFCSSVVSDTCSNSIRVVKVYKQVRPHESSPVPPPPAKTTPPFYPPDPLDR